jgi:hypothetical protein
MFKVSNVQYSIACGVQCFAFKGRIACGGQGFNCFAFNCLRRSMFSRSKAEAEPSIFPFSQFPIFPSSHFPIFSFSHFPISPFPYSITSPIFPYLCPGDNLFYRIPACPRVRKVRTTQSAILPNGKVLRLNTVGTASATENIPSRRKVR